MRNTYRGYNDTIISFLKMFPPSQFPSRPPMGGMGGMPGMSMPKEEAPVAIENLEPQIEYSNLECLNIDPKTPVTNALKQDTAALVVKYCPESNI